MKKLRMILDLIMVLILPLLMGYSLVDELYHEIIGMSMAALFGVHIFFNRKWFLRLFKGKYTARRIITTAVNLMLCLCVLCSMVSAVFLSKHIFSFLGITFASSLMRTLHMLAAYWGFVLMSFHAGSHGGIMISKIRNRAAKYTVSGAFLAVSAYGIFAFIKRGFADFLFGRVMFVFFDFSEPFAFYYLDYLSVMILFITAGYLITKVLAMAGNKENKKRLT